MALTIHTDGGSRNNPGPAASAFIIRDQNGKLIHQQGVYLGHTTNNQAEYRGVFFALEYLQKKHLNHVQINFYLDSLLVVNQLSGTYKIKDSHLSQIASEIKKTIQTNGFSVSFTYIPRNLNADADHLVNQTLDLQK